MPDRSGDDDYRDQNGNEDQTEEIPRVSALKPLRHLTGHSETINRLAWSPDNRTLATPSNDQTIRLWDMTAKAEPIVISGPTERITSAAWSPDGSMLAAGSGDSKVWLWHLLTGQSRSYRAHTRTVFSVAWSLDGKLLASGSGDTSIAICHAASQRLITLLRGHSGAVHCVAWSPNGKDLASCSEDQTVRIWDVTTGRVKRILEGHTAPVYDLAWSPDGSILASASQDLTIRLWGRMVGVLEGHTGIVNSLSFSFDGKFLASKSMDGSVRLWRCDRWETVEILEEPASPYWTAGLAFHPNRPVLATLGDTDTAVRVWRFHSEVLGAADSIMPTVRYTAAKVVLVGDSGVGKTGLADALLKQPVTGTISTHGRHVRRLDAREHVVGNGINEIHEIYLWDMAGQPSYRLVHQLHLNQVVVALVVFDVKSDTDPFSGVKYWVRALRHAQQLKGGHLPLKMFLVAGRIDRGGVGVSRQRITGVMQSLKFDRYFETSAYQGDGVPELEGAIQNAIDWEALPKVSSTWLFQTIKNFLSRIRESKSGLLYTVDDLYDTFIHLPEAPEESDDLRAQFETCIALVESQALIRRFSFGNLVLLQPEILDAYASAMISAAKDEADGVGSIVEEDVKHGRFRIPETERIADEAEEQLLLIATVEDLIQHEIALRDEDANGVPILVFPSQSARPAPEPSDLETPAVIFAFDGPVLNVYAMLAVRLSNSRLFTGKDVYENATFFVDAVGGTSRVYLETKEEGRAEVRVYFDEGVSETTRKNTEEYIHAHLMRRAIPGSVRRRRPLVCGKCGTPITDLQAQKRREMRFDWIPCPVCSTKISLVMDEERATAVQVLMNTAMVTRLDRLADTQRERQRAISIIQGKRLTDDHDIFFCHNGADKPGVKQIGEALLEYGILPWLDEWELQPGQPWQPLVEAQILKSKRMAFFVGAHKVGTWQQHELYTFMDLKRPVILVFLPNAPRNPDYPAFLKGSTWVDFRKSDPDPLGQLIWGITGTNPRAAK